MSEPENINQDPVLEMANDIINTNDARRIYEFARDLLGAPIDKLADAVIKTNDAHYIYYFARDIRNAPIDKLADGIVNTGDTKYTNAEYIYYFALSLCKILSNNAAHYFYFSWTI